MNWHIETLPKPTKKALEYFKDKPWLDKNNWYLAGGTALAMQVGHRVSVDLDFFTPAKTFLPQEVVREISPGVWESEIIKEGTIYGKVSGAKVSFIAYPFFLPAESFLFYEKLPVLDKRDIAVMKIIAISQRGRKRDFLDLFWIAKNSEPLSTILPRLKEQYPGVAHDYQHILKSLMYFADAESDPMPELYFSTTWEEIKSFFNREVPVLARKLILD